jgi:hypothetical protein
VRNYINVAYQSIRFISRRSKLEVRFASQNREIFAARRKQYRTYSLQWSTVMSLTAPPYPVKIRPKFPLRKVYFKIPSAGLWPRSPLTLAVRSLIYSYRSFASVILRHKDVFIVSKPGGVLSAALRASEMGWLSLMRSTSCRQLALSWSVNQGSKRSCKVMHMHKAQMHAVREDTATRQGHLR